MAFIQQGDTVYSFADYDDVVAKDSRLFDANEGLSQTEVEDILVRSTERILNRIRSTDWWKSYYVRQTGSQAQVIVGQTTQVPAVQAQLIIDRRSDFTELCVLNALSSYLLPSVADFGNPDSAERQKMGFYEQQFNQLFDELITAGDWYDFDQDDTIEDTEKYPGLVNLRRVR